MPEKTGADREEARRLADDLAAQARAGATMADLREAHIDRTDAAAPDSLTIPFEQLSELPPAYAALGTAQGGTVVGPIEFDPGDGDTRYAVVEVVEVREAGAYTFEDLRPTLASRLQEEKQRNRVLEGLRERTFIEVRRSPQ
jgi:hypothetical protein